MWIESLPDEMPKNIDTEPPAWRECGGNLAHVFPSHFSIHTKFEENTLMCHLTPEGAKTLTVFIACLEIEKKGWDRV